MKYLFFLLFISLTYIVNAQSPENSNAKTENASSECMANLSTMHEFVKIKVYDYALPAWRYCFNNCPGASKNIYIDGVLIFKNLVDKEKDPKVRENLIDTLMLNYDRRLAYFHDSAFVYTRKGLDMIRYMPDKQNDIYNCLNLAIKYNKNTTDPNILIAAMQISANLYSKNQFTKDQVIDNYAVYSDIFDAQEELKPSESAIKQARDIVDRTFIATGVADCNKIIEINTDRINDEKTTLEQLKQILKTMENIRCTDSDIYLTGCKRAYSMDPSAPLAYKLAKLYVKKQDYNQAIDYYNQAIAIETDPNQKALYYFELAAINASALSQPIKAKELVLKAIENRKDWGQPYLLLASIYASSSSNCGSLVTEKKSVFWAAVDKCVEAKNVDPSVETEANEQIAKYSQYFPTKEELFFDGLKENDSYTVKCWINETTRVRAKN